MAKESVKGYDALSERNKAMVRKVIRDGRAKGVSDDVVIAFANVSARAKIDVVWDSTIDDNAYYDPHAERIVVNPKKQSGDDILIHELDHALRKTVKGGKVTTKIYERAIKATSEDTYKRILDKYGLESRDDMTEAERAEVAADEANAYFAQNALGNKDIMKHLLSDKPSLKERILDFFKGAVKDYQKVPKLERQAARYYKQFKKWFDDFAGNRRYGTIRGGVSMRTADASYSSVYFSKELNEESSSIKTQLLNHETEINQMDPVSNIVYNVVSKEQSKKDALDLYKTRGLKVDRQNFGLIELSQKELEESSGYINTPAEMGAWMTIPHVLKRGQLISGHENHKKGGFSTYTIAAPVIINGKRGNVAVVVKKTGKYRYKMHRILTPEGSTFVYEYKKENAEPTGSDILLGEKGPDISSASTIIIPETEGKNNPSDENSSKKSSDRRSSIDLYDDADRGVNTAPTLAPETTVGELRQKLANSTRYRVYSKAKIVSLVKNFSVSDMLSQKTQNKIADSIWQSFNSASRSDIETYSRDMAEFIISRTMQESKVERTDIEYTEAREVRDFNSKQG